MVSLSSQSRGIMYQFKLSCEVSLTSIHKSFPLKMHRRFGVADITFSFFPNFYYVLKKKTKHLSGKIYVHKV